MIKIPIKRIHPIPEEPVSSGSFKIRTVQDLLAGKDMVHELHRHDFFFILALHKGKGAHEIDFTKYYVYDHSIFFLRPGQVHQLELKAGSTGYLMEFDKEFYHSKYNLSNQRLRKASNKNFCQLDPGRFKKLYSILTYIFQEYTSKQEGYREVIKANLDIFFIEFVRQSRNLQGTSHNINLYSQERLEELLELLETHITDFKQVSQYADMMNLSPYQLNAITKATIGKTTSDLINEHLVLEAKKHLLATTNQVKDIAFQLGFEDVSYFIRFFKKHTGYSPEVFRHNSR
jgi:AraC family transcriptional regulator, transcriptional activator of pobA